jgi:hypothetical protein
MSGTTFTAEGNKLFLVILLSSRSSSTTAVPAHAHRRRILHPRRKQRINNTRQLPRTPSTTTSAPSATSSASPTTSSAIASSTPSASAVTLFASLVLWLWRIVDKQGIKRQRVRKDKVADGGATDVDGVKRDGIAVTDRHLNRA